MNTAFNLEKLKLELKEIDEFKEDEPPEVDLEKEPYSKLGDLYMIGFILILLS
ncbi:hypothetical protein [Cetobacterium sp.]|uniref:hypothetical protein n=1 Tax=Cetobacterium sp. TaxID=2071632 RepID=UPI003F3FDDEC